MFIRLLFLIFLQVQVLFRCAVTSAVIARDLQVPLTSSQSSPEPAPPSSRRLHGRFLHITDIHPDPLYRFNATIASSCHRPADKKFSDSLHSETGLHLGSGKGSDSAKNVSGYWGAPLSHCDASLRFVNLTFNWLEKEWADQVDFVIWTGDSARHDNDNLNPRTLAEIFAMNAYIASRMEQIFTKRGVPVVPSLGNNDIWPHNILLPGPNEITNKFVSIWSSFIPFSSYQVFQRGAYFSKDIIPEQLGVLSLNTMYFYNSNKAVGGCTWKDGDDPGNLEFDWMEVQLGLFRDRGMKVWLIGHVPPTWDNYFPECYRRYLELSMMFQDTIVGHLYGHLNIDFFFFLPAADLDKKPAGGTLKEKKDRIHKPLKKHFKSLPDGDEMDETEWAVVNVAPSLVANPYLPGLRMFGYNTTGTGGATRTIAETQRGTATETGHKKNDGEIKKKKKCKKKKNRDNWECRRNGKKWHTDKEAPARMNTLWSPLGYAQFWMPGLGEGTEEMAPTWELEYMSYPISALHDQKWVPIPLGLLPGCLQPGGNVTGECKSLAPYGLEDLTLGSWAGLARRVVKEKTMWKLFKKHMYLGG